MKSAIVLLSSGLDSTINLYQAKQSMNVELALTFDYGQRAASSEIRQSKKICEDLGIKHQVVSLDWLKQINTSSLDSEATSSVPVGSDVAIDSLEVSEQTARSVWVPNRNGVFLNMAAAYADAMKVDYVIPGFNKEEAATFPDNSQEFLQALDQSFCFSTKNQVKTKSFTTDMVKSEIVRLGRELKVNFELLWPCYFSGDEICGKCESCQRYLQAIEESA